MATTSNLRPILDQKRWELCGPTTSPATQSGSFIVPSAHNDQKAMVVISSAWVFFYYPDTDGWHNVTSAGLAGTFGPGACGACAAVGLTGTATAGSTTTLTTNLTTAQDLRGYQIHITGGPGAGDIRNITSSTIGANTVITVGSAFSAAITSSSTYRLLTPRWYILNAGTQASGSFKSYDPATNTWTTRSITNLPATIGTDGVLVATPSYVRGVLTAFGTGTATSGAASTISDSGKTWTVNQWTNYQIRLVSGTGAGQIRTIASNTSNVITVSSAWTTQPDSTSVYSIEGNDDFLYFMGNASTAIYRYSISADTWTALTPGVARGAATSTGMSGHWISSVTDSVWTNQNAILNGRYIYTFRGNGNIVDIYDIPGNAFSTFTPATGDTLAGTGAKFAYSGNFIYFSIGLTSNTRPMMLDLRTREVRALPMTQIQQGSVLVGNTMFTVDYVDGATTLTYLYFLFNTSSTLLRMLLF